MLLEKEAHLLRNRVKSKEETIKKNGGMSGHSCKIGGVSHEGVQILASREKMERCSLVCAIEEVNKRMGFHHMSTIIWKLHLAG